MKKKKFEEIKSDFEQHDLILLTTKDEYIDTRTPLIISNGIYKILKTYHSYSSKKAEPSWFSKNNPYIIYNINQYLKIKRNGHFTCISNLDEYISRESILSFKCNRCGRIIKAKWSREAKAMSDKYDSRHGITCEHCDGIAESLHASALKQVFVHIYPDTILEDKTCINPITNTIMPTDIVNHNLKIAIEIQGQFHKFKNQKIRDEIKKNFWINKGYSFYDYSIDKISVLDYIKLFFPEMKEIPEYVNLDYSNKLNLDFIQDQINKNVRVQDIANDLQINSHRIYDAIYYGKLHYPDSYNRKTTVAIVQLDKDGNLIAEYPSFKMAEQNTNINSSLISSCIYYKHFYCKGYYWFYKSDYDNKNYSIPENRKEKFYQAVECYDLKNTFIKKFDDMYQAAEFCEGTASKIYEVTQGKRKTVKGYKFSICDN